MSNAPTSTGPQVNAETIATKLITADGTYSITAAPFRGAGYVVALPALGHVIPRGDLRSPTRDARIIAEIAAWVRDVAAPEILAHPAPFYRPRYLGSWVDSSDGTLYLDVVEIFQDRAEAVEAGRDRDQIAIWDAGNGCEIATGGTGAVD